MSDCSKTKVAVWSCKNCGDVFATIATNSSLGGHHEVYENIQCAICHEEVEQRTDSEGTPIFKEVKEMI